MHQRRRASPPVTREPSDEDRVTGLEGPSASRSAGATARETGCPGADTRGATNGGGVHARRRAAPGERGTVLMTPTPQAIATGARRSRPDRGPDLHRRCREDVGGGAGREGRPDHRRGGDRDGGASSAPARATSSCAAAPSRRASRTHTSTRRTAASRASAASSTTSAAGTPASRSSPPTRPRTRTCRGSSAAAGPLGLPGRPADREDLDRIVPDRPVFLANRDGHDAWVNSMALEIAGITRDTPDPRDGRIARDPDGTPMGTLHEGAMALVNRHVPPTPERTSGAPSSRASATSTRSASPPGRTPGSPPTSRPPTWPWRAPAS